MGSILSEALDHILGISKKEAEPQAMPGALPMPAAKYRQAYFCVRLPGAQSNECKSRIRPAVGMI